MKRVTVLLLVLAMLATGMAASAAGWLEFQGVWRATGSNVNGEEVSLEDSGADFQVVVNDTSATVTSAYFRYGDVKLDVKFIMGGMICNTNGVTMSFRLNDDGVMTMKYSNKTYGIEFSMTFERVGEATDIDVPAEEVTEAPAPSPTPQPTATPIPEPEYETLQKGSKGDAVKRLQLRLIELNYLTGSADGDYGNKTKEAVEKFQAAVGLTVDGIADSETQERLFASNAPAAKVYKKLDYKAISRDPDAYVGQFFEFSGTVVQVLEEQNGDSTYVEMRIATKSWYDDIVFVTYIRKNGESRILEDDKVKVLGQSLGLYTYEAVMGNSVTLPLFLAESVTVK